MKTMRIAFLGTGQCAENQVRDTQLGLLGIAIASLVVTVVIFWKVILNKKLHVGWRILGFIGWLVLLLIAAAGFMVVSIGGACADY